MDVTTTPPRDWRGTPITPGALVIYGAPVGRSIAMVEAIVAAPMTTPSGRIWLNVQRRAYGSSWAVDGGQIRKVHVGADRLTVVTALPPTLVLTEQEKADRYPEQQMRLQAWLIQHHARHGHTRTVSKHTGYAACNGDCGAEGRRFTEAWEMGEPLDERS